MKSQRGGFAMGLIVGLLIGLALALAVALYVTKVPVPFVNKVPQRTAEQDAAEQEKNRNWDPNAGLVHKPGARPSAAASTPAAAAPAPAVAPPVAAAPQASAARDPAAILAARESTTVKPTPAADPFNYFVQAGAFAKPEDAEQQRARLAMMGYEAKVTEREQSGRTVYRVRIGPFPAKDAADGAKDKLAAAGVDSALVRVQK
jgi:cell division protein FtsN